MSLRILRAMRMMIIFIKVFVIRNVVFFLKQVIYGLCG